MAPSSQLSQPLTLWTLIRRHRAMFSPYGRGLAVGVVALMLTNLLGLAIPWQIKEAIEALQALFPPAHSGSTTLSMAQHLAHTGQFTTTSAQWLGFYRHLIILAVLAVFTLVTRVGSRVYLLGTGRNIEGALRNRLYAHLLGMPPSYFSAHPVGEVISRVSNDVDAAKMVFGGGIMIGLNTIFIYVFTIPLMLKLNPPLALVTFLLYPIVIFLIRRIGQKVRLNFTEVQAVLAEISQTAQENLSGMGVIQSYALEETENRRFQTLCARYRLTYNRLIHQRLLMFIVLAALSGLSLMLVTLVGGGQVIANKLDWGGFVAFMFYLEHLAWPTMSLGWTISIFQQGTAALQRIDDVLQTESTITAPEASTHLSQPSPLEKESTAIFSEPGRIEIRDLSFTYRNPYGNESGNEPPEPVLHDLSLVVQPGETIALVGPVGSGKSTLLRLLPRLAEVPGNTVFVEGRDITTVDPALLRSRIVFMPQSSFLFSTTVERNIAFSGQDAEFHEREDVQTAYRRPDESESKGDGSFGQAPVLVAAELAGVHLDIANLPRQYETLVGERGLMLSGGQRQRVALARTLLVKAGILLLDDPFSNVDADTEQRIVNAIQSRKVLQGRTTIIATHRFSVVGLCDRVALMDKGRLVAVGTPEEMMATQPLYQRLHRLQMLRETLGEWEMTGDDGNTASPNQSSVDADPMEGR